MRHSNLCAGWLVPAVCVLGALPATAVTLYDPALGTLPSAQGWMPLVQGAAPAQSLAGGSYVLDTTGAGVSYYVNGLTTPVPLNTATGFDLSFTLRVDAETHTSPNRAGYSVVLVGADPTHSLEVSFWAGNVWVPDYDGTQADRFIHGLDASWATSSTHSYTLSVRNQQYTLVSDGTPLLSGALHDYTAAGLTYTVPNSLFFGDDSSRGTSITALGAVLLAPVPEPAPAALLAGGLVALAWRRTLKNPARSPTTR